VEAEIGEVKSIGAMEGGNVTGGGSEPSLAFTRFEPKVLKEERFGQEQDVLGSGGGVEEGEGLARGVWAEAHGGGGLGDVGEAAGDSADNAGG
jgi:hypothetical protein